jgi:hypothetical protein
MRDVEIAAAYHRFLLLQGLQVGEETAIPILAIGQATQVPLGVGHIDRNHKEVLKLRSNHTAFAIVTGHP